MTEISKKIQPFKRNLDTFKRVVNYIDNTKSLGLLDMRDFESERKNKKGCRYL